MHQGMRVPAFVVGSYSDFCFQVFRSLSKWGAGKCSFLPGYISTVNKVSVVVLMRVDRGRQLISTWTVTVGKEDWILFILNFLGMHFIDGLIVLQEHTQAQLFSIEI